MMRLVNLLLLVGGLLMLLGGVGTLPAAAVWLGAGMVLSPFVQIVVAWVRLERQRVRDR